MRRCWSRCAPIAALLVQACAAPSPEGPPRADTTANAEAQPAVVRHWGEMRAVLREGRTEARVELDDVLGPNTIAVGALAGLAGEITALPGATHLAEVVDPNSPGGVRHRSVAPGEQATLLVAADVAQWSEHALGAQADLASLEASIREIAAAKGLDVSTPFPFRVEGEALQVDLHVLDHSCPIAAPDGPEPWRYSGEGEQVALAGFYAEQSTGILTHHGRRTHTHVVLAAPGYSGHLDQVVLAAGARLFLPLQ